MTYITLEQVLFIHEVQIQLNGGSSGLRDLSLLESAIFRPQSTFNGQDLYKTPFEKAAAYLHSLLLNHAFIDGNKRTAFATSLIFLQLNNIYVDIENPEVVRVILDIEKEKWDIAQIASWFESHIQE